jgi:threonine dehydratase
MDLKRPEATDVLDAHERLNAVAVHTPLLRSDRLDAHTGGKIFVKCESLQRSGSFKFRGACNISQGSSAKPIPAVWSPIRRGITHRR